MTTVAQGSFSSRGNCSAMALQGLVPGEPIPLHQAIHLLVGGATDHDQVFELFVESGLDHERGVHHDLGQRLGFLQLVEALEDLPNDFRVYQIIQPLQAGRILEHDIAQFLPVDLSCRVQNLCPECVNHRFETRLPFTNQTMGHPVRVDHDETLLFKPGADR